MQHKATSEAVDTDVVQTAPCSRKQVAGNEEPVLTSDVNFCNICSIPKGQDQKKLVPFVVKGCQNGSINGSSGDLG